MARPRKRRQIGHEPNATYYKPQGIPLRELEEIELSLDELEALRLKDLEEMDQEQAARHMGVSRATFQRILAGARKKVAEALIESKALRIKEREEHIEHAKDHKNGHA